MKDFLTPEEEQAVVAEIRAAETLTSGEIRVLITSRWKLRPMAHAWKLFHRHQMDQTENRNGALIVLFIRRRKFVVLGDKGFDGRVEPAFWQGIADTVTGQLHEGRKVEALAAAIRQLGTTMATHWPPETDNPDELPNEILRD